MAETKQSKLSVGAEAVLLRDGSRVTKERLKKSYRIPEIDVSLRKQRTKREAKVIASLQGIIPVPELIPFSTKELADTQLMRVFMRYIPGPRLRDILNNDNCKSYGKTLGSELALMHNTDIIHGDMTTSNLIVHEENGKLYIIDFGLSFFSIKVEDKAVELHLLQRALESKHPACSETMFQAVLGAYKKTARDAKDILKRLSQVEGRGRHKQK